MNLNKGQKVFLGVIIGGMLLLAMLFMNFSKTPFTAKRDVTLTVWGVTDAQDELQIVFDSFQTYLNAIPGYENVTVKFSYRKWGEAEYETILINQLAEGKGPDIFFANNTWIPKHHNKMVPAPAWIITPDLMRQTFVPVVSEDMMYENTIYGIPLYVDTLALYYNMNHFRNADFANIEPAKTWEDFQDQVAKLVLKESGPTGLKRAGAAIGSAENITSAVDILYLMMLQEGAKMCDDACTYSTFNDPTEKDGRKNTGSAELALQLYSGFSNNNFAYYTWDKDFLINLDIDYKRNEIDAFVEQQVTMIFGYSDIYQEITSRLERSKTQFAFAVASVPQLNDPDETGVIKTIASYYAPGVSRNSENPDVAWIFINYATSKDQLSKYNTITHRPTSRIDLIDLQKADVDYGLWARQAKEAAYSLDIYDKQEYDAVFKEVINDVVDREKSVQEAIDNALTTLNQLLYTYSTL